MSDDNHTKPSPRGTRLGLGLSGTDASSFATPPNQPRPAAGQRHAAPARTVVGVPRGPLSHPESGSRRADVEHVEDVEDDTRYMEPPSETHGFARNAEPQRGAAASQQPGSPGLFGSTLEPYEGGAHHPREHSGRDPGLLSTAINHAVAPTQPDPAHMPSAGSPHGSTARAPDAWRDEVRRMVDRGPAKSPAPTAPGAKPSLRLKLDAEQLEEAYRPPKSAVPKVLTTLVVLGSLGGAAAYYASTHGGLDAVIARLTGSAPAVGAEPTLTPVQPTATGSVPGAPSTPGNEALQPTAAPTAPTAPTTATPAAATTPTATPDTTRAAPGKEAAARQALDVADPEPPSTTPSTGAATPRAAEPTGQTGEAASKAAASSAKAKPKPSAPAAKAPARTVVRRQEPVVKVRPIDSPAEPAAAPEPAGIPYVPVPYDPPAPDEPR